MKRLFKMLSAAIITVMTFNSVNAAVTTSTDSRATNFAEFLKQRRMERSAAKFGAGAENRADLSKINTRPANIMKANAMNPKGTIYGVVPTYSRASSYYDALYVNINLSNGKVSPIYRNPVFCINESDYYFESATARDNILYIPNYNQHMVTGEFTFFWDRVDLTTGNVLEPINFKSTDYGAFCYSLTYNPGEDMFYGLSLNAITGNMGLLVKIDPKTWDITEIANVGSGANNCMVALAYCAADGNLYGLKDNGTFYSINATNGRTSVVREFDDFDDYFMFGTSQTPQALVYDAVDHCFVTIYRDSSAETMRIAYIDYADGEFQPLLGQDLDGAYFVAALICGDQYADDEAPAKPEINAVEFEGPALSGTITFTAPELTYNDIKITSPFNASLSVDGSNVYSATVKPGEKVTVPVTLTQGLHKASLVCSIDKFDSPAATQEFYVGYDSPLPPVDLILNGYELSWSKPADKGANNGYINPAAVTYNVYLDGEKINAAPVTECKYTIEPPAKMARYEITVIATAEGMDSEPCEAVSAVLGKSLSLPYSFAPTKEETELLTFVDANHDGNIFGLYKDNGKDYIGLRTAQYYQQADDWIFLPMLSFPDAVTLYNLSFNYSNVFGHETHYDTMEIYLCDTPSVASARKGTQIYSHVDEQNAEHELLSINFPIPAKGDYIVAIHSGGGNAGQYRGIKISELSLASLAGSSVKAPALPTDVKITAAPKGELKALIEFTAPEKALDGSNLSGNVTVKAVSGSNSESVNVAVGQKASMSVKVDKNGFNKVTIIPSNGSGEGVSKSYRGFFGNDVPSAPVNVKGVPSDDNMTYTITWDAAPTGANGGYVDPAQLTYNIYTHSSATSYYKVGSTEQTTYVYKPASETQVPTTIGPAAQNDLGESNLARTSYLFEFIGKPLEIPTSEEFSSKAVSYPLWRTGTDAQYSNVGWDVINSLDGLGIGSATAKEGALIASKFGENPATGRLMGPKVSTKNIAKAAVEITYWEYNNAAKMIIWARSSKHHELFKLAEYTPGKVVMPNWQVFSAPFTEDLLDCGWVQLFIDCEIGAPSNSYFIMDTFKVIQNYDNDFKVADISGNTEFNVGENGVFTIDVVNSGLEAGTASLNVELLGDNVRLASQEFKIGRTLPGRTFQQKVTFPMLVEYLSSKNLEIKATVTSEGDELEINNTRTYSIKLGDNVLPLVDDLKASWVDDSHNAANLSWNKPDASYGDREGFEYIPEFRITDKIRLWKNVDGDGQEQFVFSMPTMRWEGDSQPSAWTVYNPSVLGTENEARLQPHSGSQYLMARSIAYNEYSDEPSQNQDWLISPEVKGGTKVSFWMNTIDTQYTETIDIWVSSTDDKTGEIPFRATKGAKAGSFTKLCAFSKSGTESWEKIEFTLPKDAKYFAFVYCSIGQFGACLDDIEFTPANLSEWEIESYNVYRTIDGKSEKIASAIKDLNYADTKLDDTSICYHVTTNVTSDGKAYESPAGNAARIWQTGVEEVSVSGIIAGGKGVIAVSGNAGNHISIYTTDGKLVKSAVIHGDSEYYACEPGVYVVKVGNVVAKVLVK